MLSVLGGATLLAGGLLAPLAAGLLLSAGRDRTGRRRAAGVRVYLAACGLVIVSTLLLLAALVARDFSLDYVVHYTSTRLPRAYSLTALWAGNDGSLLFWSAVLCGYMIWTWSATRREPGPVPGAAWGMLAAILSFFAWLILIHSNPWRVLAVPAEEGMGMNPQLQNPAMMYHPPTLYMGYVGMSVPFAFAFGALLYGRLDARWIRLARRWTLTAWFFLAAGNLMGAWWAYDTLGWGGYWAWDPVENAAFMPLLTATAFLHSVMMQEKKGMLKVWNMVLVILSFGLTIFGTFLTRSGVVSSVHSFAKDPAFGAAFLGFLALVIGSSFILLILRLPLLASEHRLEAFLSREATFLFNNLLFVACAFTVFFGTLYPVFAEAVTGHKITVGPPFFNAVIAPFFLGLLLLVGICPLIAWRRATPANFRKNFLIPLTSGILCGALLIVCGMRQGWALAFLAACAFVTATHALEYFRGTRARSQMTGEAPPEALVRLVSKNPRRYGGYLIHLAVVFVALGVTVSSLFKTQEDLVIRKGESAVFGPYSFTFRELGRFRDGSRDVTEAVLDISDQGKAAGTMRAVKDVYPIEQQVWTRPAIRSSLVRDIYVTLSEFGEDESWVAINVKLNPMVAWIWLGGAILAAAALVYLAPKPRNRKAKEEERLKEEKLTPSGGAL